MKKSHTLEEQSKILKGVDNVVRGLFAGFEKEGEIRIAPTVETLTAFYNEFYDEEEQDDSYYRCHMGSLIEDFAKAPAAPFLAKHPVKTGNEKFVVESIYNGLLEHFLWFKIERQEGSSVIGDKMSFIQRRLIRAIKEGKNLNLQPTYADYPKRKMHEDEKPDMVVWWASKLFKDTDDLVEQFRNWYFIRDNKKE